MLKIYEDGCIAEMNLADIMHRDFSREDQFAWKVREQLVLHHFLLFSEASIVWRLALSSSRSLNV